MATISNPAVGMHSVRFPVSQLLIFYLPVVIVILAASFWFVSLRMDARLDEIIQDERTELDHIIGFLGAEVARALHHLRSIASEEVTEKALGAPDADAVQAFQDSFLTLARRNPFYQQIRWIDETGMERIRVMRDQGEPYPVAPSELQDKGKRYYFSEANALPLGDLYISPLDLDVEHGQIELPLRPMLRIATPVASAAGERRGIIVINIAVKYMFDVVRNIAKENIAADYIVVNHEGLLLSGGTDDDAQGMPLYRDASFSKLYPSVWKEIAHQALGTFESARGLWVWQTPALADTVRSMAQVFTADDTLAYGPTTGGFSLTLIAHIPSTTLVTMRRETRMPVITGAMILLFGYGFSLYFYLRGLVIEQHSKLKVASALAHATSMERLKELEERFRRVFDASSTGLLVVDEKGSIEVSNPAAEGIFGYQKGGLDGFNVDDLLPPDLQKGHARLRQGFMQAPATRRMGEGRELKAIGKDGREIPVEVGLRPYSDEGKKLVLVSVIDLSQRKGMAQE